MNKPTRPIRLHQTGNAVRWVQKKLGIDPNGDFDEKTLEALHLYLTKNKKKKCDFVSLDLIEEFAKRKDDKHENGIGKRVSTNQEIRGGKTDRLQR